MKIKLKLQASAEEILAGSWRLAREKRFKKVWLKQDLNEDERIKLDELWEEAKKRKKQVKMRFYWKVKDMKLRKWYIRRKKSGEVSILVAGEQNKKLFTLMQITSLLELNDSISENKLNIMEITD